MTKIIRYLTHPQVNIDPNRDVRQWGLNDIGRGRVLALVESGTLSGTTKIVSSAEVKAVETAQPIANILGLTVEVRSDMHENDRSATGFLPSAEFETTADEFFSKPTQSVRGWETAKHAQDRILHELKAVLSTPTSGDILIVGHGAVGTLLYCALAGLEIDRKHDQGPGGGGNFISFKQPDLVPQSAWQPMETL